MRMLPILLLLAASGCSSSPDRAPLPRLGLRVDYVALDDLLGLAPTVNDSSSTRLAVTVHRVDASTGTALDTRVTAILADRGRPFRAGSRLLHGLSLATQAPNLIDAPAATATAVLAGEFATRVRVTGSDMPDLVLLSADGSLQLLLQSRPDVGVAGETVLLEPLQPDAQGTVTLLHHTPGSGLPLAVTLRLGDPATASDVAAAQANLRATTGTTTPQAHLGPIALARHAVGKGPRRGALLGLAASHDLDRCLDLLLCIEEPNLVAIAEGLPDEGNPWQIERAFWSALVPAMQRGELAPAARVCVRRHLGVLATEPTGLEFALTTATSIAEFEAALVHNNTRALDDRRASRRVTAGDWLAAHGQAIPDYDPLAPRPARKAALTAYERQQR